MLWCCLPRNQMLRLIESPIKDFRFGTGGVLISKWNNQKVLPLAADDAAVGELMQNQRQWWLRQLTLPVASLGER
ncbi:hypothetical protein Nepgr_004754 [Nepenthes gracilis]|uniref:Uncharacterized protein n=1 Tax=Nepenthes gracilis TaxID=150966 RepID=A0AAD3S1Y9_NEPGR|nr:hypothetical protein Nepgr_004754 [Nepenthes gracilis]